MPEAGVTFYAGTFVRHPLALAATKAILGKIKAESDHIYEPLEKVTKEMADLAKIFIEQLQCDVIFEEFASIFYIEVPSSAYWGHLLFLLMRMGGIHIQQNRANFLTISHTPDDVNKILTVFKKSLSQMVQNGLIEGDMVEAKKYLHKKNDIPENARLGRNVDGQPAYFIEDPENPGEYIEVGKP